MSTSALADTRFSGTRAAASMPSVPRRPRQQGRQATMASRSDRYAAARMTMFTKRPTPLRMAICRGSWATVCAAIAAASSRLAPAGSKLEMSCAASLPRGTKEVTAMHSSAEQRSSLVSSAWREVFSKSAAFSGAISPSRADATSSQNSAKAPGENPACAAIGSNSSARACTRSSALRLWARRCCVLMAGKKVPMLRMPEASPRSCVVVSTSLTWSLIARASSWECARATTNESEVLSPNRSITRWYSAITSGRSASRLRRSPSNRSEGMRAAAPRRMARATPQATPGASIRDLSFGIHEGISRH